MFDSHQQQKDTMPNKKGTGDRNKVGSGAVVVSKVVAREAEVRQNRPLGRIRRTKRKQSVVRKST